MHLRRWIWVFVGVPLVAFAAGCWQIFSGEGNGTALMQGVPFLIGCLMGYLVLASDRGLMRLPQVIGGVRGWYVVALALIAVAQISLPNLGMCRKVAQYANAPCMANGLPPVNVSPVLFLCFAPPVFTGLYVVLRMVFVGFICVLVIRIVLWMVSRQPMMVRNLWRTLSFGWGKLSIAILVLVALSAFFVEPFIRFGVLEPLRNEAKGIAEIDDLVREHDVMCAGGLKCPQENAGQAILHPREPLLALYGKYGACTKPGYEHISTSELVRLSPTDREFLLRILTAWDRQKAVEVLKKTTVSKGDERR